jgi:ABC-2 type transport system permease protein
MATRAEERSLPASAPRGRGGWRTVAAKELSDHFHSIRLLIVVLLLGLAGVAAVYSAATTLRDAASEVSGTQALFLLLFGRVQETQRLPSFYEFVALLGPLLGIAFGFDAVNGERAQGTLPRLLSQPIYRDDVLKGKFVAGLGAIGIVLTALVAFVSALGMIRLGIVPSLSDGVRIVAFLVVTLAYIGFWLALSVLFSVVLRRAASSALAAIAAWLVTTLFAAFLVGLIVDVVAPVPDQPTFDEQLRNAQVQVTMSRLSPSTLYEEASLVLLNPRARSLGLIFLSQLEGLDITRTLSLEQSVLLALGQIIGLVALTVVAFAAAYIAFMRQEVRA